MNNTYPLLELSDASKHEPVSLVIWHIRAIYETVSERRVVTRVEFTNGDVFDSSDRIEYVLMRFHEILPPKEAREQIPAPPNAVYIGRGLSRDEPKAKRRRK